MIDALLLSALATAMAWIGVGTVRRLAPRIGAVSVPNARSSHARPTPSCGGLGLVLAGGLAGAWLAAASGWTNGGFLVALSLAAAGIGLWDDLRRPAPTPRLIALFALGAVTLFALVELPRLELPAGWVIDGAPLLLLALIAGVGWINVFNFMDGTDGLAGLEAAFLLLAGAGLAAWAQPAAIDDPAWTWMLGLAAACLGFLAHNWPPATIFMGNVGSTYLGFLIFACAALSLERGWVGYGTWIILAALFLADAGVTLARRIRRGDRFLEAHRSHAYQRLARRWRSHRPVALLALAINGLWLLPLAFAANALPDYQWPIAAVALTPLLAGAVAAGAGLPDHA